MKNNFFVKIKKATSSIILFMLLFSFLAPLSNVNAIGTSFQKTEVQANSLAQSATTASWSDFITFSVSPPASGDTITIWWITYTFLDDLSFPPTTVENNVFIWDTTDEAAANLIEVINGTNCTPAGSPDDGNICSGIVPDANVVASSWTTSNNITLTALSSWIAGNVSISTSNPWLINVTTPLTWWADAIPATAQIVDFTPILPENFLIYRAKINWTSYNYSTTDWTTVKNIVEALQASMDTNEAVTCTEDDTKITCTADVAGTAFTYDAEVVDKETLYNTINAEFTDWASRTIYNLTESDYSPATWSAYTTSIASAISLESNLDATTTMLDDAIIDISTKKSALELDVFTNTYQLTSNSTADSNIDSDFYNWETYVIYQRDSNIYFKKWIWQEELIWFWNTPAIAVWTWWVVHVAYQSGSIIYYQNNNYWTWNAPISIVAWWITPDLDISPDGTVNIVLEWTNPWDSWDRDNILLYTWDGESAFTWEILLNWFYQNDWGSNYSSNNFSYPNIKIDNNWNYHIAVAFRDRWKDPITENQYIKYISNKSWWITYSSPSAWSTALVLDKNSLALDSSWTPFILYKWSDWNYYLADLTAWWNASSIWSWISTPSLAIDWNTKGVTYIDSSDNLRYIESLSTSFVWSSIVEESAIWSNPTLSMWNSEVFVHYIKTDGTDNEVILRTSAPVYTVSGQIDNVANSFVSSLWWNITLSSLETDWAYSLMSWSTLVSSWVLVASWPTWSLQLNPSLFTTYGKYSLTLSWSYNWTTTSSIDSVDLYISPVDYVDMYVNTIWPALWVSWVQTNLWEVSYSTVMNFTWLYFEETQYWKILFSWSLNLTDSWTINFLQNLPSYLSMDDWFVSLSWSAFSSYPATITMYNLPKSFSGITFDADDFVVKSTTWSTLDWNSMLTDFDTICDSIDCSIEFDTQHFTSFDLKPFLTWISYRSNNAYSWAYAKYWDKLILEFTWSEALTGTSIAFSDVSLESLVDLWWNHYRATSTAITWSLSMFPNFSIRPEDYSWNIGDVYSSTTDWSSVSYDITNPSAEALYSPMWPWITALDVIATLANFSEVWTVVTNNGWLTTYTFTDNWSFTFNFRDYAWNTWSTIATVNYINKSVPVITLNWSWTINIEKPWVYNELWAIWDDDTDWTWTVSTISWSVNTGSLWTYTLQYIYVNSLWLTGSTTRTVNVVDTVAPTVTENTPVTSLTGDNTPNVVISASELSTPSFSGSCNAWTWTNTIWAWNNTITFFTLTDWVHNDCYITLTDASGNHSTPLYFTTFTVDTEAPIINYKEIKDIKYNSANVEVGWSEANMWSGTISYTWWTSTWTSNLTLSWNIASTSLLWLDENTLYVYSVILRDSLGNTTTQTGNFTTAKTLVLNTDSTETWAISLDTWDWLVEVDWGDTYSLGWNLFLYSDPNDDNYMTWSLTFSGVNIYVSTWTWDWVLIPPTLIDPESEESATWSEIGNWVTIIQTIKAWSETTWLTATWGLFEVSFMIPWYSSWTIFSLYRSENWNIWTLNTPDSHCTLDADLMCTFETDHLSFFAPWFDTEPDAFTFTALTDKELSTSYESNTITVAWTDTGSTISIVWWEYKIWTGSYVSSTWTVNSGDTVTLRQTSSSSNSTLKTATLTIGWVSANFNVTTKATSSGWWSGGGWWWSPINDKDDCPNWDYSISYYDKTCWTKPTWTWTTSTEDENNNNEPWNNLYEGVIWWVTNSWSNNNLWNNSFNDIDNSFAKEYIEKLLDLWLVQWYSDGSFGPDREITRAEFLSITMKALKIDLTSTGTNKFTDVDVLWMEKYVIKAQELWIINGQTINWKLVFRPNDSITRAEALSILFKAAKIDLDSDKTLEFKDKDFENWMIPYIIKAQELWIINGQIINWELMFRPNSSISRAETAKIVVKFIEIK